jgi:hypothetical protein
MHRILVASIVFAGFAPSVSAQAASAPGVIVKTDVIYSRVQGSALLVDLAYPERGDHVPAIMYVHGGRWRSGAPQQPELREPLHVGAAGILHRLHRGGREGYDEPLMFERYTEQARRVLFFSRYEASQFGSISIETEHLLLGLIREDKGLTGRIFAGSPLSRETLRKDIEGRTVLRKKVPTSVEIPFSAETKRVLQFAAEEADRLLHNYIGTEHLMLGLLREESSVAALALRDNGFELAGLRNQISAMLQAPASERPDTVEIVQEIEHLKTLLAQITLGLDRLRERLGR